MTKRRKQQRRNRRNNNGPDYVCIGVVVKNPNKPLQSGTVADIFGAFAQSLPKYSFKSLMALKKSELIAISNKEGVKIWLCWNKTRIANAILDGCSK